MRIFKRKPRLPADERPALDREERVLTWARVGDTGSAGAGPGQGVIVVTNRGVWLPGRDRRLGWHEVHKAVWSGGELAITPAEVVAERAGYAVVADLDVLSCLLLAPGEVPHQVRARVTRSVAYTAHHRLGAGGVRVAARRVSGVDGLTWTVRYDPGTVDADALVEQTDHLVAAARAATAPVD